MRARIVSGDHPLPDPYDIWVEHNWWDSWYDYPWIVVFVGSHREYQNAFRTKFMAKRYKCRVTKRVKRYLAE